MVFLLTGLLGRLLIIVNKIIGQLCHICPSYVKQLVSGNLVVLLNAYPAQLFAAIG